VAARTKARKAAFDALYESEQRGRSLSQALADFDTRQADKLQSLSEADYVRSILAGLDTNGAAVDATISGALREWTLARLFPVDRAILRIAVWELSFSDTPVDVVRSEALVLATQYGSDDAVSFIGGILGAVSRETSL
jgi:N utilization substance protein B